MGTMSMPVRRLGELRVAVQPIRLFNDPVLRTVAEPVTTFDRELRGLVKSLQATMRAGIGRAGLAAPSSASRCGSSSTNWRAGPGI